MVRHSRRRFIRTWGTSGLLLMAAVLSACKQRAVAPGQATRANDAAGTARSGDGPVSVAAATRPPARPHVGFLSAEAAPTRLLLAGLGQLRSHGGGIPGRAAKRPLATGLDLSLRQCG